MPWGAGKAVIAAVETTDVLFGDAFVTTVADMRQAIHQAGWLMRLREGELHKARWRRRCKCGPRMPTVGRGAM